MYCIECGAKLPNDSKYCPQCGAKKFGSAISTVNKEKEIEEVVGKSEIVKEIPSVDYEFLKKAMGWYLSWVLLHLGFLLIGADEIISSHMRNDRFWPFSHFSTIENYDIREFLVYTIFPFALLIIWSMIQGSDENSVLTNRQTVYRKTTENSILKIVSVNNQSIGAEVFIKNEYAPDGEYNYLEDDRRIIVKNGRIEQLIEDRFKI